MPVCAWVLSCSPLHSADPVPIERDLTQPILVGAPDSTYPYSFRDKDGQLKGFSVDLLDAVARVMHLKIERRILDNPVLVDSLRSHRVDMLQFCAETEERRSWASFSVPILRFETVCVVRKNDSRIRTVADLKGKLVAVGQRGTVGELYLLKEQPQARPIYSTTTTEYLQALAKGDIDAAVLSRLTAVASMDRLGIKNLEILEDKLQGYDVRYCFAVTTADSLLLARLNEGLAILHRTGEFDKIYRKWFGRYEGRSFSLSEMLAYVSIALALAFGVALLAFLRQRSLWRRIVRQANEIDEQRSLLAALYERLPLATLVLEQGPNQQLRIISFNKTAAELFDLSANASGRVLDELGLDSRWQSFLAEVRNRSEGRHGPVTWEQKLDGSRQLIESTLVPLGHGKPGRSRLCILCSDITRQRLNQEELARSRRQRALGELVGGIAHEFNNLLTPVLATTGVIRNERPNDKLLHEDLAIIAKAASNAATLTRRLLAFGRKGDEHSQPVDLQELVTSCLSLIRPTVDRRIELGSAVPSGFPPLTGNATNLTQIVFNLLLNARDTLTEKLAQAQPPGSVFSPRINVSVSDLPPETHAVQNPAAEKTLEAWLKISVTDNGLGIAPENIDRLFEPFFTTKEVGKGTGLGLATVWHLVNDMGGQISVDSTPGQGSVFHVVLPRWKGSDSRPPFESVEESRNSGKLGGHLLIVEDEELIVRSLTPMLEKLGYKVTPCSDGEEAWALFAKVGMESDLLLIDLNMPKMNGIDFIRQVRTTRYPGRIVVMSGHVGDEDLLALKDMKVDVVITKPFTAETLVEGIQRAVAG